MNPEKLASDSQNPPSSDPAKTLSSSSADVDYQISPATYKWSVKLFSTIKRLLGVNIKLHHSEGQLQEGQIFLFNHFARFETFIPQYLIYQETGVYCRSIASSEFFSGDDRLTNFLHRVGAVPNTHPDLLYFLAMEILRGRKVVVFPEGGMVKDRQVIDEQGGFSIYSRTALERREHHSGAAILALVLDAFKTGILSAHLNGDRARLERWVETLGLASHEQLLMAALKPTLIVPANITFYPLRADDNLLRKGSEILDRGTSPRKTEELLIEGNILLKHTDMDIRLGDPIHPADHWPWWERLLFRHLIRRTDRLHYLFDLHLKAKRWDERLFAFAIYRKTRAVRQLAMERMYRAVTVNQSHLAACLIMRRLDLSNTSVERPRFFLALYLAIKELQKSHCHLHRSLQNPRQYHDIIHGQSEGMLQFLSAAEKAGLIEERDSQLCFHPKLSEEQHLDDIRVHNPISVYANEVAAIKEVDTAIKAAELLAGSITPRELSLLNFDDQLRDHAWNRSYFQKPRFEDINNQETATQSGAPFLSVPDAHSELGVMLVHGFLASPAEMRVLGEQLSQLDYPVLGVRLAGHGTSPFDLRKRSWEEWLQSLRRSYRLLSTFCERIVIVGFSSGGALSLLLASEHPEGLAGVSGVCVPVKFRNRNLIFMPLVHGANTLMGWTGQTESPMAFRPNESEHPEINYRNIPTQALNQLRHMVEALNKQLPDVSCPIQLFQSDNDPVINPKSAELLMQQLGSEQKQLTMVDSDRHGILYEDIAGTQKQIITFIRSLEKSPAPQTT